ncbi:MAG TPA: ABC transporter permease [Bacteroidia bacterium]|nr:ABC transporter permease [Bacteroidia bacterium]
MKTLLVLLQKEFRQILRNKAILPLIFVMPTVQLLILPLAADYEIKNIKLAVVDQDHSPLSARLIAKISASGYFRLTHYGNSFPAALHEVELERADLVLSIPSNFEKDVFLENKGNLQLTINAINGVKAGLGGSYLGAIIRDFVPEIKLNNQLISAGKAGIETISTAWYNPYMDYNMFMVPGILAALVTMIGSYMTALNIVKERESGTIEQINVTPIHKFHFILAKLIPFWVIGMLMFSVGLLLVAKLVYGISSLGSLWLLYAFLAVYLVAVLGLGLLISTFSETQQQAMSVTFFFVMIFMLMSGLFTPVDSMPLWARMISYLSPLTYFIDVMRLIVLKGSQFSDLKPQFLIILGFALVMNVWAVRNYRKTN